MMQYALWGLYTAWADKRATARYVNTGLSVGDTLSYSFMGDAPGLSSTLKDLERFERAYAARGFRTISIDDFISVGGGYEKSLGDKIGVRRVAGEAPVLHIPEARRQYEEAPAPTFAVNADGSFSGTYWTPTTE